MLQEQVSVYGQGNPVSQSLFKIQERHNISILVATGLTKLSSFANNLWHIALLTFSYILPEILRITGNNRNRNLEIFLLFYFQD